MRSNKYGVRGLSGVRLKRGLVYFWIPPVSLQKVGIFKHKTLGTDFNAAVVKARDWNAKLEAYRSTVKGVKPNVQVYFCDPRSPWQRPTASVLPERNRLLAHLSELSEHDCSSAQSTSAKDLGLPNVPADRLQAVLH
jgi:hypothetical protein